MSLPLSVPVADSYRAWAPAGFFQEWAMRGSEGWKYPIRVQGHSPGGGPGQSPQKLTTFSQNNA